MWAGKYNTQKMINKQVKIKIIQLIGSMIVCLIFLIGLKFGWFVWQTVERSPEKVVSIIAIKGSSIWIRGSSKTIYYNEASDKCQKDCWVIVTEPPTEEFLKEFSVDRSITNCSLAPPLLGAIMSMAECRRTIWQDFDSVYVLRFDGNIVSWHFKSGGEWEYLCGELLFICLILAIVIYTVRKVDKWIRMAKASN